MNTKILSTAALGAALLLAAQSAQAYTVQTSVGGCTTTNFDSFTESGDWNNNLNALSGPASLRGLCTGGGGVVGGSTTGVSAGAVANSIDTAPGFTNQSKIDARVSADYEYTVNTDPGFVGTQVLVTFEALVSGFHASSASLLGSGAGAGFARMGASIAVDNLIDGDGASGQSEARATRFPSVENDADSGSFSETIVVSRLVAPDVPFLVRLSASAFASSSAQLGSFGSGSGAGSGSGDTSIEITNIFAASGCVTGADGFDGCSGSMVSPGMTAVPLPMTAPLLLAGLAGLAGFARRRG